MFNLRDDLKHWMGGKRPLAEGALPTLRRADAHPDAPARRPLCADRELGTRFLDVTASDGPPPLPPMIQGLPADLDVPLSAYHPGAIPQTPLEPVRPVAPLARPAVFEPGERFETFPLVPPQGEVGATLPSRRFEGSIENLLERLERGVAQREEARREQARQEEEARRAMPIRRRTFGGKLGDLRRMAAAR